MAHTHAADFKALRIAVLTVSDTRDLSTDSSGQLLADALATAGHQLADRAISPTAHREAETAKAHRG